MDSYLNILSQFKERNLPYVVIGTYALKRCHPTKMADYLVQDCDIVVPKDYSVLIRYIKLLKRNGWTVKLWEEIIDEPIDKETLKGKYYLRAHKGKAVLDLTYESPYISFDLLLENSHWQEGINCASLQHILHLKQIKGREIDFEIIRRFQSTDHKT